MSQQSTPDSDLRREMIASCRAMNERRLNTGTSGNVSVRTGERFLLTPSGMPYDRMEPADIVEMDFKGGWRGRAIPSSEWRLHTAVLAARRETAVVMHSHAMYCTTLAVHGLLIPPFHYMVAALGGTEVRCTPYLTPNSQELADAAIEGLGERHAVLLGHHGVVVVGGDLRQALERLALVEYLAEQYWRARQLGDPPLLSARQMDEILELFLTYGREAAPGLHRLPEGGESTED